MAYFVLLLLLLLLLSAHVLFCRRLCAGSTSLTVKRMNVENDAMNLETRRKGEQNKLAAHKSSLEHRQEEADALREKVCLRLYSLCMFVV